MSKLNSNSFLLIVPSTIHRSDYLYSIYIVMGFESNLKMISSLEEVMYGLIVNTIPFYRRDLIYCSLTPAGVGGALKTILCIVENCIQFGITLPV